MTNYYCAQCGLKVIRSRPMKATEVRLCCWCEHLETLPAGERAHVLHVLREAGVMPLMVPQGVPLKVKADVP